MFEQEWLVLAGVIVAVLVVAVLLFFSAMARFLKRPSPSEAIIRIGRSKTEVFIGRATWIVPILHRAATMSLSTIGITTRRAGHDALVSRDFIPTNLSAEFYIRVEPNEEDVKKAARTIGIDEGHASTDTIRQKAQELLEPKLVGALRSVAAGADFLTLHLKRDDFAKDVSEALHQDLQKNGFTLESVTITELTQTPLSEMRTDDIFGASGRETVTNTVVAKNIAVKRKVQEEAEQTAAIERQREINVARENRELREGKAKEEEAAVKAELAKNQAIEARDLQRQAAIAVERAKREETEIAAQIQKQKKVEAEQVDKEKTIEAALVDKQITLTMKAKESAEADAHKAAALALREKADQEVITVKHVAEAEREKRVTIVNAEQEAEKEKIAADVAAYQKTKEASGIAQAQRESAQGAADAIKIKAKAEADAAEMQAMSITRLAEARREAGLKEAEVERQKVAAQNSKARDILLAEVAQALITRAPEIVRELVKPAERIGEVKVLQLGGMGAMNGTGNGAGAGGMQALGTTLGPVAKTILEASAMMPIVNEMMKFAGGDQMKATLGKLVAPTPDRATPPPVAAGSRPPAPRRDS